MTDNFRFSDNVGVSGTIDGKAGTNTLDYSLYVASHPVTVNLANTSVKNLNGGTGRGFTNITSVVGGAGVDTLIAANTSNTWKLTAPNKGTINTTFAFSSFETVSGGSGADIFSFANGATMSGRIYGANGTNWLDYSAYSTSVTVNLATGAPTPR